MTGHQIIASIIAASGDRQVEVILSDQCQEVCERWSVETFFNSDFKFYASLAEHGEFGKLGAKFLSGEKFSQLTAIAKFEYRLL